MFQQIAILMNVLTFVLTFKRIKIYIETKKEIYFRFIFAFILNVESLLTIVKCNPMMIKLRWGSGHFSVQHYTCIWFSTNLIVSITSSGIPLENEISK